MNNGKKEGETKRKQREEGKNGKWANIYKFILYSTILDTHTMYITVQYCTVGWCMHIYTYSTRGYSGMALLPQLSIIT